MASKVRLILADWKNCLWWPCLPMDQNEMSNVYRGPTKFHIIWPSGFRGKAVFEIEQ
jgi:hypothetical protein